MSGCSHYEIVNIGEGESRWFKVDNCPICKEKSNKSNKSNKEYCCDLWKTLL